MLLQEQLENRNIYLCKPVLIQLKKKIKKKEKREKEKKDKETKVFNAVLKIIMTTVQRIPDLFLKSAMNLQS